MTLSVIVTCYNIEQYVSQCLESVLSQTLAEIEVVVVDDGSTDGTPGIIRDFARRDPRVVPVLLPENSVGGVATAANAGLDRATGDWVGFMDGDDFCEPDMFQLLVEAARACDADLSMCRYQTLDTSTGMLDEPADEHRWAELDRACYPLTAEEKKRFLQFVAVPWRKVYRRDLLETNNIRFPVGDYFYEDNPFHWFSVLSARTMAVVPQVLCFHRVARSGQTMHAGDARLLRMFDHHAPIRDWVAANADPAEFNAPLLGWVISQLEWIGPRTPQALRHQLFDTVRAIIDQYDDHAVRDALTHGQKGARAADLVAALQQRNYAGFIKAVDAEHAGSSPLTSARYHLRHSGIRTTAQLTVKYAREKTVLAWHRYRRRQAERSVPVDELFFALTVVDNRLSRIEERLSKANGTSAVDSNDPS